MFFLYNCVNQLDFVIPDPYHPRCLYLASRLVIRSPHAFRVYRYSTK